MQLCATPPGEKGLGKEVLPCPQYQHGHPVLPNTTSLAAVTRACAKTPGPSHGGLHLCIPPAPGCSRRTDLQHPSPACISGVVPRGQLSSACAEPAPGASPGKAPSATAPSSSVCAALSWSELGPAGRLWCLCPWHRAVAAIPAPAQGPECSGGAHTPRQEHGDSGEGELCPEHRV